MNNINFFEDENVSTTYFLRVFYLNKKNILLTVLIFFFIGILYSLSLTNTYKSYTTFYPHNENNNNTNSNIRGLAGLAGISLENQDDNLPINLYPELISSNEFKFEILNSEIGDYDKKNLTYRNYLLSQKNSFSIESIINIPFYIVGEFLNIFKSKSKEKKILEDVSFLSQEDHNLFKILDSNIKLNINNNNGIIELAAYDYDPYISAKVASSANTILQNKIIEYKLKNINDVYEFTRKQLDFAKSNFYQIQDSLANFRDSNINIKSDKFKNQLNRLETEYSIAENIYNELAITKERIAIDVKKNTPIFTIIDSVYVPNEKYGPDRKVIVLIFSILGLVFSFFWHLLYGPLKALINNIKIS